MTAQPPPPQRDLDQRTRRGLTYDDTRPGDVTIVRETLTPDHLVVAPVEEVRLHLGQESTGSVRRAGWARVTVEMERGECRLLIDDVLRHAWQGDFSDWRSRIAVGPRRSKVSVRELTVESLTPR